RSATVIRAALFWVCTIIGSTAKSIHPLISGDAAHDDEPATADYYAGFGADELRSRTGRQPDQGADPNPSSGRSRGRHHLLAGAVPLALFLPAGGRQSVRPG